MNARDLIRASEGTRFAAYDDATGRTVPAGGSCQGIITIGNGHTGPDVYPGLIITQQECDHLLEQDEAIACRAACGVYGPDEWSRLDVVRQAALIDMAYNMGQHRLAGFLKMLHAMHTGDWQSAHDEALGSVWARQVGRRADRDAKMLLTGEWPATP